MPRKRVLVIGATGLVGSHIVPALVQRGHKVHAFVREATLTSTSTLKRSRVAALARRGVVIHQGSLDDHEPLVAACKAVEVVVSAVGPAALGSQTKLLAAIRAAGTVHRFLPSEYGGDPSLVAPGRVLLFDDKRAMQRAVERSAVPYTYLYSNCLASHWAAALGQAGERPPTDCVTVLGRGNVGASITTLEDNGRYVARVIEDPRASKRAVAIVGDTITQTQLIEYWERATGGALERTYVEPKTLDAAIADASRMPERAEELRTAQLGRAVWLDGITAQLGKGVLNAGELYPEITRESPMAFLDRFRGPSPSDAIRGPVRAYLDGVRTGDPATISMPFALGYASEQPAHPARAFMGPRGVEAAYGDLLEGARDVQLRVHNFTVQAPDADGVAPHWLEIELDVHRRNGTVSYLAGVVVLGSTSEEIRWGRAYVEPIEAPAPR